MTLPIFPLFTHVSMFSVLSLNLCLFHHFSTCCGWGRVYRFSKRLALDISTLQQFLDVQTTNFLQLFGACRYPKRVPTSKHHIRVPLTKDNHSTAEHIPTTEYSSWDFWETLDKLQMKMFGTNCELATKQKRML